MIPERRIRAEKTPDTTLDDEKYDVTQTGTSDRQNMTDGAQHADVTVLCNLSEAFASDLGDYQSRYLMVVVQFWAKESFNVIEWNVKPLHYYYYYYQVKGEGRDHIIYGQKGGGICTDGCPSSSNLTVNCYLP